MTGPHGTGVLTAGASRAAPGARNPALSRHTPAGTHPTGGRWAGAGSDADADLPAPAASAAQTALGPSQHTGAERARGSNRDRRANSGTAPKSSKWEISRCPSGEGPSQVPALDRAQRGRGREGPRVGTLAGAGGEAATCGAPTPCASQAPQNVGAPKAGVVQPLMEKQTPSTAKTAGRGGVPVPRVDHSLALAKQMQWTAQRSWTRNKTTWEAGLGAPPLKGGAAGR